MTMDNEFNCEYKIVRRFSILPISVYEESTKILHWSWLSMTYIYKVNVHDGCWVDVKMVSKEEYNNFKNK
jgi:hypothetical protein